LPWDSSICFLTVVTCKQILIASMFSPSMILLHNQNPSQDWQTRSFPWYVISPYYHNHHNPNRSTTEPKPPHPDDNRLTHNVPTLKVTSLGSHIGIQQVGRGFVCKRKRWAAATSHLCRRWYKHGHNSTWRTAQEATDMQGHAQDPDMIDSSYPTTYTPSYSFCDKGGSCVTFNEAHFVTPWEMLTTHETRRLKRGRKRMNSQTSLSLDCGGRYTTEETTHKSETTLLPLATLTPII
jgi:hypothetical protein